jgi:hypothetical protein
MGTLARYGARRHQNRGRNSGAAAGGPGAPDLRALFLAIAAPLKCRPDPRYVWDDVARADPRSPYPWEHIQAAVRGAIQAGARREDVSAFCAGFTDALLAEFRGSDRARREATLLHLLHEEAEALGAQADAHAAPTETNVARAARETREAIAHQEHYLAGLGACPLELVP